MITDQDIAFMKIAMDSAKDAETKDEVPVGALIVKDGVIIARAANAREKDKIATHHAEVLAIEEACRVLGGWRLPNTVLYVTMEPCVMCAGAIINARIPRVVFGTYDQRFGAFGSLLNIAECKTNHKVSVEGGCLDEENRNILSAYFKRKRQK